MLLATAAKFARGDAALASAIVLSLFSVVYVAARICLIAVLIVDGSDSTVFLLGATGSFLVGGVVLGMMLTTLHLDPVVQSSQILSSHESSFNAFKAFIIAFGPHFSRLLYSGLFTTSLFNSSKLLATVTHFRWSMERLCMINLLVLETLSLVQYATSMIFYDPTTDVFQCSAVCLGITSVINITFVVGWMRGPWGF